MNGIVLKKQWIEEFAQVLNTLPSFSTRAQDTLIARILSLLIEHISTEADLIRVIDTLDEPFSTLVRNQLRKTEREEDVGLIERSHYRLLERLILILREYAGYERDAIALAPYIKVMLGEVRYIPDDEQAAFIARCLFALLREIPFHVFKTLHSATLLWPFPLQELWQTYIQQAMPGYAMQLQAEEQAKKIEQIRSEEDAVETPHNMNGAAEQDTLQAIVNTHRIERPLLDVLCSLLNPYLSYEYECQPISVYQALGLSKDDGPPTALSDAQVRAKAKEILINDVLIQESID